MSGKPISAFSDTIARSQTLMSERPSPVAAPFTAAITTDGCLRIASIVSIQE
jgi:hypothetical protein